MKPWLRVILQPDLDGCWNSFSLHCNDFNTDDYQLSLKIKNINFRATAINAVIEFVWGGHIFESEWIFFLGGMG